MDLAQAKDILQRYREGKTSHRENQLVEQWYGTLVETGEWEWGNGEKEYLQQVMEEKLLRQIGGAAANAPKIRRLFTRTRTVAAAVVVMIAAAGMFLLLSRQSRNEDRSTLSDINAPHHHKATITLSNGQVVYLDSAGNGTLATQGHVNLVKNGNGDVAYQPGATQTGDALQLNTLQNPRGSKVVKLMLADGTKVWLDAGSALSYPVSFPGRERRVSITGEAYFEVAHNAEQPFYVEKSGVNIKVLGTHFNVNAHNDEASMQVSLLEGAVAVSGKGGYSLLKPGQQAQVRNNGTGKIEVVDGADLDGVMAWKNGYFHFSKASLRDVMKQLSRWYDVEVVYESELSPKQFVGDIERDLSLAQVLNILEKNGVRFSIDGNKIIVKK